MADSSEILALLLLCAAGWYWYDGLRAREAALRAGRTACERDQLLFLDETVVLESVRFKRDTGGKLRLRRRYAFEFSAPLLAGGDNRRDGTVLMLSDRVESLSLAPFRLQ
ncbi:MAG: DUF3301 domain-containing protein [Betaproteobacteria bacterium]|nr:DUF3301 domain-containing protein [Betaproteobacteria bacterium]